MRQWTFMGQWLKTFPSCEDIRVRAAESFESASNMESEWGAMSEIGEENPMERGRRLLSCLHKPLGYKTPHHPLSHWWTDGTSWLRSLGGSCHVLEGVINHNRLLKHFHTHFWVLPPEDWKLLPEGRYLGVPT